MSKHRPTSDLDITRAAERLSVHPMTVRRYIASGLLPSAPGWPQAHPHRRRGPRALREGRGPRDDIRATRLPGERRRRARRARPTGDRDRVEARGDRLRVGTPTQAAQGPSLQFCNPPRHREPAQQARGIHGLTSPHTVKAYRDAWQDAVDAGLTRPAVLGAEVELPAVHWCDRKGQQHKDPSLSRSATNSTW